jgi:hypothetical protein
MTNRRAANCYQRNLTHLTEDCFSYGARKLSSVAISKHMLHFGDGLFQPNRYVRPSGGNATCSMCMSM